jgi:hypothetical protein
MWIMAKKDLSGVIGAKPMSTQIWSLLTEETKLLVTYVNSLMTSP